MSKVQDMQSRLGIHLLTGNSPAGLRIETVFGLEHATAIVGANFVKDFFARIADVTGGRVSGYEKAARGAVDAALEELALKARDLGANILLNVEIDTSAMGSSMVMASAYGTAAYAVEEATYTESPPRYTHPQPLG